MTPITNEQIDAARTPAGGFTRDTLAQWGVPWPPPHGWRKAIVARGIPYPARTVTPATMDAARCAELDDSDAPRAMP
jgi:hypothetical protein